MTTGTDPKPETHRQGQDAAPAGGERSDQNGGTGFRRVLGAVPTLLVLAAMGGVGFWGHRTGWEAPRFSQLTGSKAVAAEEDWCTEHSVPESRCIKCRPELVGANTKDWCPEHGLPESKCTICHPEILTTGVAGDWCPEHAMPESSCTLCHPEIAVKGTLPASETAATVTLASADGGPVPALASLTPATKAGDGHDHGHGEEDHAAGEGHGEPDAHGHKVAMPAANDGHDDGDDHADARQPSPRSTAGDEHDHDGEAGGHQHAKDPKTCQTHNLRVQFASADAVRKAGVQLGQVAERPMAVVLSANAEVGYDSTRLAQISSPVGGRVWRVEKEVGQPVRQGEVVAIIDAAEVGRSKAEYLQAVAEYDLKVKTLGRLRTSAESGFRTEAELREAEAASKAAAFQVFNAQQALVNLGLSPATVTTTMPAGDDTAGAGKLPGPRDVQFLGLPKALADSLDPATTTANLLPLVAPFDGTVIERGAVAGEMVEPSKPLLAIADTRRMWVTADVPLTEARQVRVGQAVTFRPDGAPDDGAATGKVAWVSTAVDDRTRTVKVRADVANPDGRLLAHTFGKARVTVRPAAAAVAVPAEALQWEGCCRIVFVRLTDEIFQARKVALGARAGGFVEVLNGLLPGEVVATAGSHVLKSEILKSALGAGCADGHH